MPVDVLRPGWAPEHRLAMPDYVSRPADSIPLVDLTKVSLPDLESYTGVALGRLARYFDRPAEQQLPMEAEHVEVEHLLSPRGRAEGLLVRHIARSIACYRLYATKAGDEALFDTGMGVTHNRPADLAARRLAMVHFIGRVHVIGEKLTPSWVPKPSQQPYIS